MGSSRYVPLLVLSVIATLLVAPVLASGSQPKKGATYSGKVHQFNGYKLPLRFRVSGSGHSASDFTMSDGPPTADSCASGPWGHPVSHSTSIGKRGHISVTMRLRDGKDNPDVGRVTVEGNFRSHGKFKGTVHTRTDSKSCNDDFPFSVDVG